LETFATSMRTFKTELLRGDEVKSHTIENLGW